MATLCRLRTHPNVCRARRAALLITLLLVSSVGWRAQAQSAPTIIKACYIPRTGTVYRVGQPDLPPTCTSDKHIPFQWVDAVGADHGLLTGLGDDDHPQYLKNGAAAGGDLAGTYPNPTVDRISGRKVGTTDPANGQVLGWNGTSSQWEPTTPPSGVTDHGQLTGLGDDDHPQYLLNNGVRSSPNGFVSTGTVGSGSLLSQDAGARLVWYPGKAAFRAGFVDGGQWNDGGIGTYSVAMGNGTIASGLGAVALGGVTSASNIWSTALGRETSASGIVATALGRNTTASGNSATSSGYLTHASGDYSTALGWLTVAQAAGSTAIGRLNVPAGSMTDWISTDPLFVVGNGASEAARSNALVLTKDGNLTIAGTLTQSSDIRLKVDVQPLGSVLDRVLRLSPIRYRFREGTGHPLENMVGLSAQAVEPVFPELVRRGADGYLSLAYGDLSAVLVGAIHEQQNMIDSLRASNVALGDKDAATQREIARLREEMAKLSSARAQMAARLSRVEHRMKAEGVRSRRTTTSPTARSATAR